MTKADVQGRLNRETNPIPGERPGFNPQFIDSDGYATDVTPNTPFPSGSYVQTDAGVWVPQKGNNDGAAHVQLTGSNVEKIYVFDGYAITDTAQHSGYISMKKYRKIYMMATNTHDVEVNLDIRFESGSTSRIWDGDGWKTPALALPSQTFNNRYLINTFFPFLNHVILDTMEIVLKANTPPTKGSITVIVFGVINK